MNCGFKYIERKIRKTMPKTGFHMPTAEDTPEYIGEYIQYKFDKMNKLNKQLKKLYSHIQKAEKVLNTIVEKKEDD